MTTTTADPAVDAQEPQEDPQEPQGTEDTTEATDAPQEPTDEGEEPDVFPRRMVEELRKENARYRHRAMDRDDLAAALWTARVEATGRLADPTDLPLPADVDPRDPDVVATAVEELLATKPHLASRRPRGDVGQGTTTGSTGIDLAGMLRART